MGTRDRQDSTDYRRNDQMESGKIKEINNYDGTLSLVF